MAFREVDRIRQLEGSTYCFEIQRVPKPASPAILVQDKSAIESLISASEQQIKDWEQICERPVRIG
jgi:hypothetical protein